MAKVALVLELGRPCLRRSVDVGVADTMCKKDLLHISKELCSCSILDRIDELDRKILAAVEEHCIPELRGVAPVLDQTERAAVTTLLNDFTPRRTSLARAFLEHYPELIESDKHQLKDLFEADEYPTQSELEPLFIFSWRFVEL